MTDNKTIIDGVDVSECCNYDDTQYWECEPTNCHCEELPNCHYKQLKRAEQKLDKIKEYCNNCNLKADFTACDVLKIIEGKENE